MSTNQEELTKPIQEPKDNFLKKILEKIKGKKKTKPFDFKDFNFDQYINQSKPKSKNLFKLIIILGILLILVFLFVKVLSKPESRTIGPLLPTPTPTLSEEKEITLSPYATDPIILKIEQELNLLQKKLESTDLNQASLNPPVLEMEIGFEE